MKHCGLTPTVGGGVYVITNAINGNAYIGSSVDLYVRYCEHIGDLRGGKHHNRHLQRAYNRYGAEVFTFAVLEYVADPAQVVAREQHYIDSLNPQYNMCRIAGSTFGVKRSAETRAKIGLYSSMRKLSPENLEKMLAKVRGKPMSEEHRAKIAAALRGRQKSPEARANLSAARRASPAVRAAQQRQAEKRRGKAPMHATEAAAKAKRGKPHTLEHRARIAAALKGRSLSTETRAKISATKRARSLSSQSQAPS